MKCKALIVDDEPLNRIYLKNLLKEYCPRVELMAALATVEEAVESINNNMPDIIFMDIELQEGTGFDILEQVRENNFQVIFTTAHDHYAIKAIKFSALDYLLKPINSEELQSAVARAVDQIQLQLKDNKLELLIRNLQRSSGEDFSISLSTSQGIEYIPLTRIIRLESKGPYTTFFIKDGHQILVCKNLGEYEVLLTEHGFFRLHNSYIINMKEVKRMIKTDGGYAVMNDEAMIAISPRKKEEFMQLMSQRLI